MIHSQRKGSLQSPLSGTVHRKYMRFVVFPFMRSFRIVLRKPKGWKWRRIKSIIIIYHEIWWLSSTEFYLFNGFEKNLFSSVQSLSRVRLFATPWIAACQASLSIINSQSLPKLMSIESVMPSKFHDKVLL